MIVFLSWNSFLQAQNTLIFRDDFERQSLGDAWYIDEFSDWQIKSGQAFNFSYGNLLSKTAYSQESYVVESEALPFVINYKRDYSFIFGKPQLDTYAGYALEYYSGLFTQGLRLVCLDDNYNMVVLGNTTLRLDDQIAYRFKIYHYRNGLMEVFINDGSGYSEEPLISAFDKTYLKLNHFGWGIRTETAPDPFYVNWIEARQLDAPAVGSFTLVNADTNKDLLTIQDGDKINLGFLNISPDTKLSIRANNLPTNTGSMALELIGPSTFKKLENYFPYTLFGENPGNDYLGEVLMPGAYTLKAIPYVGKDLNGSAGGRLEVNFELQFTPLEIEELMLVNADTDEDLFPIEDGMSIYNFELRSTNLSIRAKLKSGTQVGRVVMALDGAFDHQQVERQAPYALFGDKPGFDYQGVQFCPGQYTLKATPYAAGISDEQPGTSLEVSFFLDGIFNSGSLTLVNADTDQDVRLLNSIDTLDVAQLNHAISIRANTNECVEAVEFTLTDSQNKVVFSKTEGIRPFALNGDNLKGDYYPWNPSPGIYVLRVISRQMNFGYAQNYRLVIKNSNPAQKSSSDITWANAYPNPIQQDRLVLQLSEEAPAGFQLTLADFQGRVLYQTSVASTQKELAFDLSGLKLEAGFYVLKIQSEDQVISRVLVKE
ncbi:MAG: T9SS type A sorting domain-containing protein [Microscillaceae bacterium]|nr:T9SS type A sorting domain-containing protein [Microscillaceae bacterium]